MSARGAPWPSRCRRRWPAGTRECPAPPAPGGNSRRGRRTCERTRGESAAASPGRAGRAAARSAQARAPRRRTGFTRASGSSLARASSSLPSKISTSAERQVRPAAVGNASASFRASATWPWPIATRTCWTCAASVTVAPRPGAASARRASRRRRTRPTAIRDGAARSADRIRHADSFMSCGKVRRLAVAVPDPRIARAATARRRRRRRTPAPVTRCSTHHSRARQFADHRDVVRMRDVSIGPGRDERHARQDQHPERPALAERANRPVLQRLARNKQQRARREPRRPVGSAHGDAQCSARALGPQ